MPVQDPNASTESNGAALFITSITFLFLTWVSVLLRTYVRSVMLKGFMSDDWFMLASQAVFTVSCAFILRGYHYGLGRHNRSLEQHDEITALKYQALATATYVLNMMLIKFSIGIFLLRLATQKRYRYTIYASIVIIAIWSLVLFFWNIFQCHPVEAQWDYRILNEDPKSSCVSAEEIINAAYALSVMTILSDWLYALLPIPMVWQVKMTKQAKATVMVILGLGIFASVATLIRLKFLSDLIDIDDILFAGTDAMVWTLVEPGVAIVASSLVTIRPLLRAWRIQGFQSTENSKHTEALSNGQLVSRTERLNGMPGFGSRDTTTVDIELGHSKPTSINSLSPVDFGTSTWESGRPRISVMSRIPEVSGGVVEPLDYPSKYLDSNAGRNVVRSNVLYIEGAQPSPNLPGRTWMADSSSNSSVELDNMEPLHGQTDGRVGLGSPRELR
ncbi:uncharacterized protein BCR38DRAFT_454241 [Pseudomassariella vexata]|uniref:Rhodopsin domain-containing protein n=1 Tax=Pseudomassariella vexata TaxID=1141098 RepID=A0A1Y2EJT8_9PEZI|nr:uncharacterized protein BCR38DRAFT_454241 [Pseudomassariella vexata]ORY71811.1 hypothetical protein BCR38DRAFT_454241 [Pseudomassariella vexata]